MGEKKRGRYFSDGFKGDAAQLSIENGVPVRKVAREISISIRACCIQWRRKSLAEGNDAFATTDLRWQ